LFVKKKGGSSEKFDKKKLAKSCKKAGASDAVAREIATVVSNEFYDGISTEEIRLIVLRELSRKNEKAAIKYREHKKK